MTTIIFLFNEEHILSITHQFVSLKSWKMTHLIKAHIHTTQ